MREPVQFPQGVTSRNCRFIEVEDGFLVNAATKQSFSSSDPCFEKGTTAKYNEEAAKKAHKDVKAFLNDVFAQR